VSSTRLYLLMRQASGEDATFSLGWTGRRVKLLVRVSVTPNDASLIPERFTIYPEILVRCGPCSKLPPILLVIDDSDASLCYGSVRMIRFGYSNEDTKDGERKELGRLVTIPQQIPTGRHLQIDVNSTNHRL
jgi:hypothetical protein